MEESGRKMATSVRTLDPISGMLVKYCRMEKMAGRVVSWRSIAEAVCCVCATYLG